MQPYLKNEYLKLEEKKLTFRIRNRMFDVKMNFRKKYGDDMKCRLCKETDESQSHLFSCTEVLIDKHIKNSLEGNTYNNLFSTNLDTQAHMLYVFQRILKLRSRILKNISSQASPDNSGASSTILV